MNRKVLLQQICSRLFVPTQNIRFSSLVFLLGVGHLKSTGQMAVESAVRQAFELMEPGMVELGFEVASSCVAAPDPSSVEDAAGLPIIGGLVQLKLVKTAPVFIGNGLLKRVGDSCLELAEQSITVCPEITLRMLSVISTEKISGLFKHASRVLTDEAGFIHSTVLQGREAKRVLDGNDGVARMQTTAVYLTSSADRFGPCGMSKTTFTE